MLRAYCPNINTVLLIARAAPVIWLDEYRLSEKANENEKKSHIDFEAKKMDTPKKERTPWLSLK